MKYIVNIAVALLLVASSASVQAQKSNDVSQSKSGKNYPGKKSDAEWKKILSPIAFEVMVEGGTEHAFRNAFHDHHEKGIYVSSASGEPLFTSEDKFDSGTGWPSFTRPINPRAIEIVTDRSHGMVRKEVVEAKTGLHLGHVFDDGPKKRGGRRYCMNSAALRFVRQ